MDFKLIIVITSLIGFSFNANSQEGVVAGGTTISSSSGSASFTIGQVFYSMQENSMAQYIEGLQQPIEIYSVNTIEGESLSLKRIKIYPNPTMNFINIDFTEEVKIWTCEVYDLEGSLILKKIGNRNLLEIPVYDWPSGTYLIAVYSATESEKYTYKIIKS